jgi:hypothetical protein
VLCVVAWLCYKLYDRRHAWENDLYRHS